MTSGNPSLLVPSDFRPVVSGDGSRITYVSGVLHMRPSLNNSVKEDQLKPFSHTTKREEVTIEVNLAGSDSAKSTLFTFCPSDRGYCSAVKIRTRNRLGFQCTDSLPESETTVYLFALLEFAREYKEREKLENSVSNL